MSDTIAAADTILIAEDHPMFRQALALTVERLFAPCRVVEVDNQPALLDAYTAGGQRPRLTVLDLQLPGARGLSALLRLREIDAEAPVAVVSGGGDAELVERLRSLGATAFVSKAAATADIEAALRQAYAGQPWFAHAGPAPGAMPHLRQLRETLDSLTQQQFRVLRLLTDGLLNKQIAATLGISEGTVRAHVTAILHKLGVATRTQAVLLVTELDDDNC